MTAFDLSYDDDGALRVGWGEPDWLGPIRSVTTDGVVATIVPSSDELRVVLQLSTNDTLAGFASGAFAEPTNYWSFGTDQRRDGGVPDDSVGFGFQYCEFAMPTITDASLQNWFLFPARPSLVFPMMLIAPDYRTLLLAPLNAFHEQVMAVDGGLRCGWHGDLNEVQAGFTTELLLLGAASPREALHKWGAELQARYNKTPRGIYDDDLGSKLSYWTDNGAAYWYKTEPDMSVTETLVATVADLRERNIPFSTFQLDSWWYPHETLRPFNTYDWSVPPSGLMTWDARDDILPPGGVPALRDALGTPPLAAHCRHVSSSSPYTERFPHWIDGDRAHPTGPELYELWLDQCVSWGVSTYEHDWLIECFLGVRGLREKAGRARAWQEGVDKAAGARDITLQWCMPSPADLCQTVTLANVTSIRTSGDHGYLVSAGYLWSWFMYVNVFADALGLQPYKDVFHADLSDEKAHSEIEALLSALSTGPVGVGDRVGRTDRDLVMRTCRADGVLIKSSTPIQAINRSFRKWATSRGQLLTGTATSVGADRTWTYVVTLNATERAATSRVDLADLGVTERVVAWNWRTQTAEVLSPSDGWDVSLDGLDWDYRVLAPIVDGVAVIGDPSVYATAGEKRITARGADVTVHCAGESVEIVTWSEADGLSRTTTS